MSTARREAVARLVDDARAGRRRRVVAPGGMGKSHLIAEVARGLGQDEVRWWSGAFEPAAPSGGAVLLADDGDAADLDSLRGLISDPRGIVLAHRPVSGPRAGLLDTFDGAPAVLGPLGHDDVRELLASRWGERPTPTLADEFLVATAGNPRLLLAMSTGGPTMRPSSTPALEEAVRAERRRLSPKARGMLAGLAHLDGLDLGVLEAACGLADADLLEAAEEITGSGLAVGNAPQLPPAVVHAVRQLTSDAERGALAERAASAALEAETGGTVVLVAQRLLALGAAGASVARCLLAAAREVLEAEPERAALLIASAGQAGADAGDIAATRALVAFRQGRAGDTLASAEQVLTAGSGPGRAEALTAAAAVLAARGMWVRATEFADLAAASGPDAAPAIAFAVVARVALGDVSGGRESFAELEGRPVRGLQAARLVALADGLLATFDEHPARALQALLEAARLDGLAPAHVATPLSPHELAALVACQLWELDVASEILTDAPTPQPPSPPVRRQLLEAWVALRRGDWAGALAGVEQVRARGRVSDPREALVEAAVEAGVARRRGDLDDLLAVWRRVRTVLLRQRPDLFLLQPVGELLIAGARLGDTGTVGSALTTVRDLVDRAGSPPLWALSVHWDELHVAVAMDDLDAARIAAKAAAALTASGARGQAVAKAALVWVDALDGTAEPDVVRSTAARLADAGLAWEAARLAGTAAVRMSDPAAMHGLLNFARSLPSPPAQAIDGDVAELSSREQEVAAHVVAGLTYREIGRQLFIAPKTVEHHVARIRQKVGASSRAELLAALRSQVPVAEG